MRNIKRLLQISALIIGVQATLVVSALAAGAKPQWSPTAITDIKAIAGKWEGLMVRTPKSRSDDWVNVNIQESGDYDFASYRTIGMFTGKGSFTVKDGKATAQSEKGTVTVQLFTDKASGKSMLKAESKGKDGHSYRAELTKAADAPSKKQ
jgi:hypothetical protein